MINSIIKQYRKLFPYRKKITYEIGPKGEFIKMDNMPDSFFMDLDTNVFNFIIQSLEQYKDKVQEYKHEQYGNFQQYIPIDELPEMYKQFEIEYLQKLNFTEEDYELYHTEYTNTDITSDIVNEISCRRTIIAINSMIYYFKFYGIKTQLEFYAMQKFNDGIEKEFINHLIIYNSGQLQFTKNFNRFWA